jgi:hypothetical protein
MIIILLLLLPLFNSLNIPHTSYIKSINNAEFKVLEPLIPQTSDKNNVLFFGGLNGFIPSEIYSDFLTNLVEQNITCYICNGNVEDVNKLVNDIHKNKEGTINVVSHSSGASPALKLCEKNRNILNAAFFDPVDSSYFENLDLSFFSLLKRFLFKKENNYELSYLQNLYIIQASKSYEWSMFPPKVPFIPAFKLDIEKISFKTLLQSAPKFELDLLMNHVNNVEDLETNITLIDVNGFGHSDILDKKFSNFAHDTFIEGTTDRNDNKLNNYKLAMSKLVCYSLNNENQLKEKLILDSVFDNLEYKVKKLND